MFDYSAFRFSGRSGGEDDVRGVTGLDNLVDNRRNAAGKKIVINCNNRKQRREC